MDSTTSQPPSLTVVSQIARREGCEPAELRPPLWNAIDPEALDELVDSDGSSVRVTFQYHGYTVRIDRTGTVRLENEPELTRTD